MVMRPERKLWYMQKINLFADLTDGEMTRLAERTVMREYNRGRVIATPDERTDLIYLIKEGRVKLSKYSTEGKEQILALLEPGDMFGELALVGAPESVHVEAMEDTLICVLRREDFEELIRARPEVAFRVMRVLADRLRRAEEDIEDLVFRDVPGRLASVLLRLAEEYGQPDDSGIRLSLRLTHQDLANMIGATRETVTSILNRLKDDGLIATEQRHIVIRDRERLRRIVGKAA